MTSALVGVTLQFIKANPALAQVFPSSLFNCCMK